MNRSWRIAAAALAVIGSLSGCSHAASIDDASSAQAAAVDASDAQAVTVAPVLTVSPSLPTLDEVLAQERFVALSVALERTDLRDAIEALDGFVLLAPTGEAFATSAADIGVEYPNLMNDAKLLEAIMRYHIVAAPFSGRSWRTLNGASIAVDGSSADTVDRVGGVAVLDAISVRNGTVLVVPRLLLPMSDALITTTEPSGD